MLAGRAVPRGHPGDSRWRNQLQADFVPRAQVPASELRRAVDREIEWSSADAACPQLDGCIQDEPNDFAFLDLVFSHHQLAAASGSLPRHALQRVADLVLADLTELARVAAAPG